MRLLSNADARGSYLSDAGVRCSAPGHPDLFRATPGANLELHFRFGGTSYEAVYTELVSKPVSAFVTIDRESHRLLTVKFLHRGRP
jgi:hypothetical protein